MPKISSLPTASGLTNYDILAGVQNGVTKKFSLSALASFFAAVLHIPTPTDILPKSDGTAATGNSSAYARGDHVHPTDTTLVPVTRTVNGKQLSSNIVISADDILPEYPASDGSYRLTVTVDSGASILSWEAIQNEPE